ncbi:hypothetical protein GQ457_02G029470 [Hibiscus cannabinus]
MEPLSPGGRVWTVFVNNISERMHWQGVWQSFDRHGEVVDVFIPRRRNRFGERFGFVRMVTRAAADRVIERLNGFWLYGSRITVAFAVKADRDTSWQRRSERISRDQRQGSNHSISGGHGGVYRRVTGVLDGSKKEVLETCVVVWCKGRSRGCSVMRAAGDVVLLLFVMAEERQSMLDRSDLDRWFVKVLPWSPDIGFDSCSVWLSVLGVPMQFWSQDTFRNVAQLWGSLVLLDESTMDPKSFEQARLLIETKHWDRIMETIEVDCDGRLVPVRVQELEVVHAHDVVCRCEEVDASSEESDRETAQDDLAELPGQVERGVMDNGEQDGPPREKEITIWREEPLLAVSGEVVPAKMTVGDREFHAVIESELESTLQKDRPTFSNPDLVGEEILSVVPIEVSDVVPGQFDQEEKLIATLRQHKEALGWTIADIKGISPTICMHKILLDDDHKPTVDAQRCLNQTMKDVVRKEILKWLDAGYNQIAIAPEDQSKTTFTCPYGTFAFRWMPFGLCNAPATFQRCMTAIFSDLNEDCLEIFMDDFSTFGDNFDNCLSNLEKVLKRCKETNLVLNWEKCHFMVDEGIVLGHKISSKGMEVDKAKIEVISKLPPPTTIKGIRSFLGHAGFYRRFIEDFSKITKPLCSLLEQGRPFEFNNDCTKAFNLLKQKLVTAPIVEPPDWKLPFELMCDASDYAVGAVLGQRKGKIFHPIYYASKTLNDAEVNYTTTEKEMLAVIFAFDKFRSYLIGTKKSSIEREQKIKW